jgi:hypothetical protein
MANPLSDQEAAGVVADALKKSLSDLESYWASIAARANVSAYQEVLGSLLARGFTLAQADAWDRLLEFVSDQMLFFSLVRGGVLEAFSSEYLKLIDRREELKTVQVFVSGVYVNPDAGSSGPGQVGQGTAVGTGTGSMFSFPGDTFASTDEMRF